MSSIIRITPNPTSTILSSAIVAGAGLQVPPDLTVPEGMAVVMLLVPMAKLLDKTIPDIQTDLGLPWAVDNGQSIWFDEL